MSFNGLHLLAPGERIRNWQPDPPTTAIAEPSDCEGCGAPLQHHLASCAWCTRPHPSRRADLGALLEVTCLDDAAPRYVPGWSNPRPSERPISELLAERDAWRDRYAPERHPFPQLERFCRWLLGVQ